MILAIEGPDKSGKTTLWRALKAALPSATFVGRLPLPPALFPVMASVELRDSVLWEALYDGSKLYVCDRHLAVSGRVYDAFYGRETLFDWRPWVGRTLVAFLRVDEAVLRERCRTEGDEYCLPDDYPRLCRLYDEVLADFDVLEVSGTVDEEVCRVVEAVETWRQGSARRGAPR